MWGYTLQITWQNDWKQIYKVEKWEQLFLSMAKKNNLRVAIWDMPGHMGIQPTLTDSNWRTICANLPARWVTWIEMEYGENWENQQKSGCLRITTPKVMLHSPKEWDQRQIRHTARPGNIHVVAAQNSDEQFGTDYFIPIFTKDFIHGQKWLHLHHHSSCDWHAIHWPAWPRVDQCTDWREKLTIIFPEQHTHER